MSSSLGFADIDLFGLANRESSKSDITYQRNFKMKPGLIRLFVTGIALCVAAGNALAAPISGQIDFSAGGCFTQANGQCQDAANPTALAGYDFNPTGNATNNTGFVSFATGDLATIMGLAPGAQSFLPIISLEDFSLSSLPAAEWAMDATIAGVDYVLSFLITSGSETDTGGTNPDIGGYGTLMLTQAGESPGVNNLGYDPTSTASWTISGGVNSVIGINVPEPAALSLLGLGLLGLGVVRRRRTR